MASTMQLPALVVMLVALSVCDGAPCPTSNASAPVVSDGNRCQTNTQTDANYGCSTKPADQMCSGYGNNYCCKHTTEVPTMFNGICGCPSPAGAANTTTGTATTSTGQETT